MIYRIIAACMPVDIAAIRETLDVQTEDLGESKHTNADRNGGCNEKNDNIAEEVMLAKKCHVNGTLRDIL